MSERELLGLICCTRSRGTPQEKSDDGGSQEKKGRKKIRYFYAHMCSSRCGDLFSLDRRKSQSESRVELSHDHVKLASLLAAHSRSDLARDVRVAM